MSGGWSKIKYRQDMPPPGGYGAVPYKRNIPVRGPSGYMMFGLATAVTLVTARFHWWKMQVYRAQEEEDAQSEVCLLPLLEAEKDRTILRHYKEKIESEALNIVGTGFDEDFIPGEGNVFSNKRWSDPIMNPYMETSFFTSIRNWYGQSGIPKCGP